MSTTQFGAGNFRYTVDESWAKFPAGGPAGEAVAVACDSKDRVYVFLRGPNPVQVFERDGTSRGIVGRRRLHSSARHLHRPRRHRLLHRRLRPHRPDFLARRKTSPHARHLWEAVRHRRDQHRLSHHQARRAAVQLSHERSPRTDRRSLRRRRLRQCARPSLRAGRPLAAIVGRTGADPGQFHVPHGIAVDRAGTVYVADRENSCIQLFSSTGVFMAEWTDVARPCQIFIDRDGSIYVAELGFRAQAAGPAPALPDPATPAAASASSITPAFCRRTLGRRRPSLCRWRLLRPARHLGRLPRRPLCGRGYPFRRRSRRRGAGFVSLVPKIHSLKRLTWTRSSMKSTSR